MDPALTERLQAAAEEATRRALSGHDGPVRARLKRSPEIPGMVLFTGRSDPAGPGWWTVGLLDDLSGMEIPAPHGRRVLEAWGYGPERTVSAGELATVMALLGASDEDPDLISRDKQVERLREALRAKAFAPRDVVTEGLIGVQWWDSTGPDTALVLHTFWVSPSYESTHLTVGFEQAPLPDGEVPVPPGSPPARVLAGSGG